MALSNESYIVNTATVGEVIVPIKETVPYLNVNLIGYQHFSYHSVMSQNLANIVDDIKALQDGGLAQATFDLDQLIADANANIDSRIDMFNDAIYAKIVLLTDEAVTETRSAIDSFQVEIFGSNGNDGVIANTAANVLAIGDESSGIIQQINVIEDAIGIDGSGGLLQQFTGVSDIVTDLALDVATHTDELINIRLIIEADVTGIVPRTTALETVVGGTNSGLVKDTQLNKDMIFGNGTYEGILSILGDNTQGLIHYIQLTRTDFDTDMSDLKPRLNYVENRLGSNDETGVIGDVEVLKTQTSNLESIVGLNLTSGLQLKVKTLEDFNIQQIRDSLYVAGTGLQDKTAQLRTEIDILKASASSSTSDNNNTINELRTLIDANTGDISANAIDISANAVDISTNAGNISANAVDIAANASNISANAVDIAANASNISANAGNVAANAVNIAANAVDIAANASDINTINTELNGAGGIKDRISNISTTFVEDALTYDDGTSTVFTPTVLYNMKVQTDALVNNDIISRFTTYFGSGVNELTANEIGKAAINVWINDVTSAGYVSKTETVIANYISSNFTMSNIQANVNAIALLNGDILTAGSVNHTVKTEIDSLEDSLIGTSGSITIINGDDTVIGSTEKKIKDSIETYDLTVDSRFDNVAGDISNLSDEVDVKIADQTSELQVEMVRYDTILPFLQKMFKYVNNPGSMEDSEIDTIFTTVADKVAAIGSTINNLDYVLFLNTTTNNFEITIKLDSDLKFAEITPGGEYIKIIRTMDNFLKIPELDETTTDAFGALVLESGLYQIATEARIYENASDTTGVPVSDLYVDDNDTIVLRFATIDIFGTHKIHNIIIS